MNINYRAATAVIASALLISILLSILCSLYWIFTFYIIVLTCLILYFIYKGSGRSVILIFTLIAISSIRYYPYLFSIPLGVDPIRDIIYSLTTISLGRLPVKPYRFVDYYKYFPSTHLTSILSSIVTGTDVAYIHYITLSTLLVIGSIPVYIIVKRLSGDYRLACSSIILYGFIPSLATWGYWVIPISFSILYSVFSILLFHIYIGRDEPVSLILSLLTGLYSVMTHPAVGIILIGFYIIYTIIHRDRILVVYVFSTMIYTLIYWWLIKFLNQFIGYIQRIYNSLYQATSNFIEYLTHPYTRSEVFPHISHRVTQVQKPPLPPPPMKLYPDVYPWYYLIPRWIWAVLFISIPFITLFIYRKYSDRRSPIYSIHLYSVLLSIFTVSSLFLHIIWKADRYVLSPASIYLVISIAMVPHLFERLGRGRLAALSTLLMFIIVVSSILEPRVSFYTNPIEGDRVTFKVSETSAGLYILRYYSTGWVATDYNLMTSYMAYMIFRYDGMPISKLLKGVPYNLLKRPSKPIWTFLLREYSISSMFIYNLNYYTPSALSNVYYHLHTIYSNGDVWIFSNAVSK